MAYGWMKRARTMVLAKNVTTWCTIFPSNLLNAMNAVMSAAAAIHSVMYSFVKDLMMSATIAMPIQRKPISMKSPYIAKNSIMMIFICG